MKETSQKWLSGNCHFRSGAGMSKGITAGIGNMSGGLDNTISWRVHMRGRLIQAINAVLLRALTGPFQGKKTSLALFLAYILKPFYNLASTRSLELFHHWKFLAIPVICPGTCHGMSSSWLSTAWHQVRSRRIMHIPRPYRRDCDGTRSGQVSHEISTASTFLAGSPAMPIQTLQKRKILSLHSV